MSDLKMDMSVEDLSADAAERATTAETFGFDGVFVPEFDGSPFLPLPLLADRTESITLGTRIATAFTRSPMVLAYLAWDLQRFSDGRMTLGLGPQVQAHNERRYSVDFEWDRPGPRFREEVRALRHIFDVFQGEIDLEFDGDFYQFSLMTDDFNPGPLKTGPPEIWVAGVNEFNLKMAGDLADALCIHQFNTPKYTEEVIAPTVARGAEIGDRDPDSVSLSVHPFLVTGETAAERERRRDHVKQRIAFYGSTRSYHDVLKLHGWSDVGEKLHELSCEEKWDEMTELITDEMVATFAIDAPPSDLADEILDIYGGIADRVLVPFEGNDFWKDVIEDVKRS